jgi:hypothetical protein
MIPFEEVPSKVYGQLAEILLSDKTIRRATKYLSPKLVVKLTARTYKYRNGKRGTKQDAHEDFVLTVGKPNYAERQFVKKLVAAGEPFPVKKIQLKFVKGTN